MRFCCLGSDSGGNAFVVEHGATTLLVDCGFGGGQLQKRLERQFLKPSDIDAVLISHEHQDHTRGLEQLRGMTGGKLEAYMTVGTARMLKMKNGYRPITPGESFIVGDMQATAVACPHDACEPVNFIVGGGGRRVGIFTDLGNITPAIRAAASGVNALIVECNYDSALLAANRFYPEAVKQRISGDYGHLENHQAASLAAAVAHPRLQYAVAAHLSKNNNRPELAKAALSAACPRARVELATAVGLGWRDMH